MNDAVVVVIEAPDGRLLLIERAGATSYPGFWNPVTGGFEAELDSTLIDTCVREAREEIGLDIKVVGKLWTSTTSGAHFVLHWFLADMRNPDQQPVPDPEEVGRWQWIQPARVAELTPAFEDTRRYFRDAFAMHRQRLRAQETSHG